MVMSKIILIAFNNKAVWFGRWLAVFCKDLKKYQKIIFYAAYQS